MTVGSLELAKWKGDTTLNHRCLYCGDSQKNKHHTWHPTYSGLIKLLQDNGFAISNEIWQEGWNNKVLYLSVTTVVNLPQV